MVIGTTETVKPSLNTFSFVPIFDPNHQLQEHRKSPCQYGTSEINLSWNNVVHKRREMQPLLEENVGSEGIFLTGKYYQLICLYAEGSGPGERRQ